MTITSRIAAASAIAFASVALFVSTASASYIKGRGDETTPIVQTYDPTPALDEGVPSDDIQDPDSYIKG